MRTVLPWIHHADAFRCVPRATQLKTKSGLQMHPCCLGQSPGCPLAKPWALGGTRHCQSSNSEPAWKDALLSPSSSSSGQRNRAGDWGQDSILLPALGIFFHPAPPPHPVLVGRRKISKRGPGSRFCFLLGLSSMLRREPEHPQEHSKGQPGFVAGSGGDPPFSRGSGGSPSTAPCTPAAFQAKSPPTYCMSPAGAWRRRFPLCGSRALERSSASPSNDVQTPAAVICCLGFWPPRHPAAPWASPPLPLPPPPRLPTG